MTVVRRDVGGTTKPGGALYIEPGSEVLDASAGTAFVDQGVDAAFLADSLSAYLVHERCGVHLYESVGGRTTDTAPSWQEDFGAESRDHVRLLEELLAGAGGNPSYVSEPVVRDILATQIDLRTDGFDYVDDADLPADHRSRRYREIVTAGGYPTEQIVEQDRAPQGQACRNETEGPNPIDWLQPATT